MPKKLHDQDFSILSDREESKRIMESVAIHLLSNRLIRAGLPLDKVNQILAQTSKEEVLEMHSEAVAMKECPGCGKEISPKYLEDAYFEYPIFRCQYCNAKLCVLVDKWHFGHVLEESR